MNAWSFKRTKWLQYFQLISFGLLSLSLSPSISNNYPCGVIIWCIIRPKKRDMWLFARRGGGRDAFDIISLEKMALYVLDRHKVYTYSLIWQLKHDRANQNLSCPPLERRHWWFTLEYQHKPTGCEQHPTLLLNSGKLRLSWLFIITSKNQHDTAKWQNTDTHKHIWCLTAFNEACHFVLI